MKCSISTKEEILSRPLVDVTRLDMQSINVAASMAMEFDIKLNLKRKMMDALSINCHFVAVTCIGRKPTHYLITFNLTSNNSATATEYTTASDGGTLNQSQFQAQALSAQQSQQSPMPKPNIEPRGSLHGSIRRG